MKRLISILGILLCLLPSVSFAARGFGTTDGSASTDRIVMASVATTTPRAYWVWFFVNAYGATSQRIWDKEIVGDTDLCDAVFLDNTAGGRLSYVAHWSGAVGTWNTSTGIGTGSWHSLGVSYAGSATTDDPIFVIDGVSITPTEATTPVGTLTSCTKPFHLGNNVSTNRVLNGRLAEWTRWDETRTLAQFQALHNGASPLSIGSTPLDYLPLCGTASPETNLATAANTGTVTGTTAKAHPFTSCPTKKSGMHR